MSDSPTNIFTILVPHDQEIGECYVVQECRATDFEAPKLWKGSSGSYIIQSLVPTADQIRSDRLDGDTKTKRYTKL